MNQFRPDKAASLRISSSPRVRACGQPLYFKNTRYKTCGHRLGYLPTVQKVMRSKAKTEDTAAPLRGRSVSPGV